jgi:nucleoside-diphosphate-sugar epimerase
MRILITGSESFIGPHLRRELQDAGHIVSVFDIAEDASNVADAIDAIGEANAESVIHLEKRPNGEELDFVGSALAAVVAQACGVFGARFVYASSGTVYGDNGATVCDELKGPFGLPASVRGLESLFGEKIGQFYAPNGFTSLRFSAIYGPGQQLRDSAVVDFLWKANSGKQIPVHIGTERSWCWVGDAVRAIRLVVEHGEGPFNVARSDDPRSMKYVAELACNLTGADKQLIEMIPMPEKEVAVRRLATARLHSLGWAPLVSLYDGMALTLEWVSQLEESDARKVLEVR